MQRGRPQADYEPVTRSRRTPLLEAEDAAEAQNWPTRAESSNAGDDGANADDAPAPVNKRELPTFLKRGHGLTYAALFLFTVILYARPAEFYPSPLTNSIAFIVGIITLAVFVPSQIMSEGTPTARPR